MLKDNRLEKEVQAVQSPKTLSKFSPVWHNEYDVNIESTTRNVDEMFLLVTALQYML